MKLRRVLHAQKKATGNTAEEKTEQDSVLTSLTPTLTFDFHSVVSFLLTALTYFSLKGHMIVEKPPQEPFRQFVPIVVQKAEDK